MGALERRTDGGALVLANAAEAARSYAANAKAENTVRAYRGDWQRFEAWAEARSLEALPAAPEAVALYVAELAGAGRKPSTLSRALVAISQAHKLAGHPSPSADAKVREVLKGIRRTHGTAPRQAAPVLVEDLGRMAKACPSDLRGLRDRALLVLGFAAALRRSELVALHVEDLAETAEGLRVTIRRSKTDKTGAGAVVGVPYGSNPTTCPVRTVRAWLEAAALEAGPVFRRVLGRGTLGSVLAPRSVSLVVKAAARRAGYDDSAAEAFAGHSLRRGFATMAARVGKATHKIMNQGRWRSETMVRRYIDEGRLFDDNAAAGLGL